MVQELRMDPFKGSVEWGQESDGVGLVQLIIHSCMADKFDQGAVLGTALGNLRDDRTIPAVH